MKNKIEIQETAFVTSAFRSSDEELSKDIYAKLWKNSKTDVWIKNYLASVSKEEAFTNCLRNRYLYDEIKKLSENDEIEMLINFGCGFSMYPFLLNENLIHIEIDKPEIIDFKREKISKWQEANELPKRKIHYISTDFSQENEKNLLSEINSIKKEKKSFILIEGVLFFLSKNDTDRLFELFRKIQTKGEFIGTVSFEDSILETPVFKRLMNFQNKKVVVNSRADNHTITGDFYNHLRDYKLMDHQDYFSLSEKYTPKNALKNRDKILNENMYLLKKTN
jgi:O-methyltransferase involved in polyketide biosynthesis